MPTIENAKITRLREEARRIQGEIAAEESRLLNSTEGRKASKRERKRFAEGMGIRTKAGRRILDQGPGAFDPNFNAARLKG